jgi:superfamily II DNA or RNA helicase
MMKQPLPSHALARRQQLARWCRRSRSFTTLEARLASLPTPAERGAMFELFAEAYLATMPVPGATAVWPQHQTPESLHTRYRAALDRDCGIDGLFQTHLGPTHAYQVKFRQDRTALTWSELATFVGLSEEFPGRLIFTNAWGVGELVAGRRGVYAVTGRELDALNAEQLHQIAAHLAGRVIRRKQIKPLPHQQEALAAITTEFTRHPRTTAILACGTGKTLIGLWTAERLQARRVLVLLPSLSLVRQTLHAWAQAAAGAFAWQCVCSDESVDRGLDSVAQSTSDLGFPVTTDSAEVARFLAQDDLGCKVVFTTYHSALVVARALGAGESFDLGIFDEAHRTAGRAGLRFSLALHDSHLPIQRRLFLTATPRHYDLRKRTRGGDLAEVYSMDDVKTYGRVCYQLGLAQAAARQLICPYQVILSVIQTSDLRRKQVRDSVVLQEGRGVAADLAANGIALQRAVEKFGLRKIFTFHHSVAAARRFTGPEGVGAFLPGFTTRHVSGAMPEAKRARLLAEFSQAEAALLSNARCLTEGVNVPAVDLVAFLSPKRSRVDIVQAVGRALRRQPGKRCGYIFVPLLLEPGEDLTAALRDSAFQTFWEVLQSLEEQDATFAGTIRQLSQASGLRRPRRSEALLQPHVQILAPGLAVEELYRAIGVECVAQLGSAWERQFGQLQEYQREHGHIRVTSDTLMHRQLATWIHRQRQARRRGRLYPDQIQRLTALGFDWQPDASQWEKRYAELVRYRERFGNCEVPHLWPENRPLGHWTSIQRRRQAQGRLEAERFQRLNALGFVWSPAQKLWEKRYAELQAFKAQHGHCNVPQRHARYRQLGTWVNTLRRLWQSGQLSAEKAQRLEQLGFDWEPKTTRWEKCFAALAEYHRQHSDCLVPTDYAADPDLAEWVQRLRGQYARGQLSADRVRRLNELGFCWDTREAKWEASYRQLAQFLRNRRNGEPLPRWLTTWVRLQRFQRLRGKLSAERIRQLDEMGFEWSPHEARWAQNLHLIQQALAAGTSAAGLPVEQRTWLKHQRESLRRGSLSPARAQEIEALLKQLPRRRGGRE